MDFKNLNEYYPTLCKLLETENFVRIRGFYPRIIKSESGEPSSVSLWIEYTLETMPKKYSIFIHIQKGLSYYGKEYSLFSKTITKWLSQTRIHMRTSLLKAELFSRTL